MPEHTPAPTPHRAVYGFAFYLLFFTLFILYVLWALLPTERLGLTYLPDKYFAVFLPMLALVGISFFMFFIYPAINMSMTPEVDALASVVDVSLLRRKATSEQCSNIAQNAEFNSWDDLKQNDDTLEQLTVGRNSAKVVDKCDICGETHRPTNLKPITPLRYLDLQQVNKELFGNKSSC